MSTTTSPDGSERTVPVPDGTIVVRPAEPADADGVYTLYAELDATDRYRRFFSGYRPARASIDGEVRAVETGGFTAVAEHRVGDGSEGGTAVDIVGTASWVPLPDGDGELAITVAKPWRGWLGPYLLDYLLEQAAARGVTNLQAEILVQNRTMLAIAHARGYVAVSHPDQCVIRLALGAAHGTPDWPSGDDAIRILVEVPGGHWHAESAAQDAGVQTLTCSGPSHFGGRGCPELAGTPCPLAAGADAIVVCRPPEDDDSWNELRAAHLRLHSEVPVFVECRRGETPRAGERSVPPGDDAAVVRFVRGSSADHD